MRVHAVEFELNHVPGLRTMRVRAEETKGLAGKRRIRISVPDPSRRDDHSVELYLEDVVGIAAWLQHHGVRPEVGHEVAAGIINRMGEGSE